MQVVVVTISPGGAVTVQVDSGEETDEVSDETSPRLAGHVLDHMLDRATQDAFRVWFKAYLVRTGALDDDDAPASSE